MLLVDFVPEQFVTTLNHPNYRALYAVTDLHWYWPQRLYAMLFDLVQPTPQSSDFVTVVFEFVALDPVVTSMIYLLVLFSQ